MSAEHVVDAFFVRTPEEPLVLPAAPSPVTRVHDASWAPAESDPEAERCTHAWSNAACNGRVGRALPRGLWMPKWSLALDEDLEPRHVLCDGVRRVVVTGRRNWLLADLGGARIARGPMVPLDGALDLARDALWVGHPSGTLAGVSLHDGAERWTESVVGAEGRERSLRVLADGALAVLSRETRWQPHVGDLPPYTTLELRDLGAPVVANADGFVTSSTRRAVLRRERPRLLVSATPYGLVAAAEHRLYWLSPTLEVRATVDGMFIPLFLSTDEAERAYLIAQTAAGISLWVVRSDGGLLLDEEIPDALGDPRAPPVVGYDHRVFVACTQGLHVTGAPGLAPWRAPPLSRGPGGVTVTGNHHAVVCVGDAVKMFGRDGVAVQEYRVENETLTVAPVLTLEGMLLVASSRRLVCLEPL